MRRYLGALVVLCLGAALFQAAPAPSVKPGPKAPSDAQSLPTTGPFLRLHEACSEAFTLSLLQACDQIVDQYVRPVTRAELLYAAIKGLYEKASQPVPEGLKTELEQATTNEKLIKIVTRILWEVVFAEGIDGEAALLVCFQAMARSLDPYTCIVTGEEQRQTLGLQAEMDGFGFEIAPRILSPQLAVTLVRPGSPAQRGGLRPNDAITHLNGQMVKDLNAAKVEALLGLNVSDGPPDLMIDESTIDSVKPLTITYRRSGMVKEHTARLSREQFRAETVLGVNRDEDNRWNYFLDAQGGIAHVRISALSRGTAQELRAVLTELRAKNLRGLILDFRWCPGGYLDEAVDCARLFLKDEQVITSVKSRTREEAKYRADKEGAFLDVPLIVLVNGDTTGGAELIAGALQDHERARIAGQRTFGKATVQTGVHLSLPYTAMRLTSGTFLRPNGKNLHRFPESKLNDDWGVRPDTELECRLSPAANRALKEAWLLQTLRPGTSRERLLLDDPLMDAPSQIAAAQLLKSAPKLNRF